MRYLPHTQADRAAMIAAIGVDGIDDLFADVPAAAVLQQPLDLPVHAGEIEVERALNKYAARNLAADHAEAFFLGAGAYRHHIPASVDHLIQRSEFLTAYTPYQPEISQGVLQYLFEFQTQVAAISGMDVANASMYDGATACAEAVLMAMRVSRRKKTILSGALHPHYREVTQTMTGYAGAILDCRPTDLAGSEDLSSLIDDETACVVVQYPDVFGNLHDFSALAAAAQAKKALLVIVTTEIVALGALKSPGEMGADIFVAEGQSIGNGLNFGGPYLGLFATRDKYVRQMPGRLAGETNDAAGNRGYVLTLSTREQHIRREKATSNICTNSGLCSLAFCIHMSLLGETGFARLAALNHQAAVKTANALAKVEGVELLNDGFFNEFAVRLTMPARALVQRLAAKNILAGVSAARLFGSSELDDVLLIAASELTTEADIAVLASALDAELKGARS
jgi:glycine dehydrogenase subunit 1